MFSRLDFVSQKQTKTSNTFSIIQLALRQSLMDVDQRDNLVI